MSESRSRPVRDTPEMIQPQPIDIRGTTTLVGLLGWPTSHSLSPPMQNAGFAALGARLGLRAAADAARAARRAVRRLAGGGLRRCERGRCIPHKQAVIAFCDELDEVALAAGSVNTLVFDGGRVLGSSTDGDAVAAQVDPRDRRALVLGTGGSSRAVVEALERAGGRTWTIASRRDAGWPPAAEGYDILVNATPVKDELIVGVHAGMEALVDLAYLPDGRDTALDRGGPRGRLRRDRRRPRRPPLPGCRRLRALDRPRGTARCDARGVTRLLNDRGKQTA